MYACSHACRSMCMWVMHVHRPEITSFLNFIVSLPPPHAHSALLNISHFPFKWWNIFVRISFVYLLHFHTCKQCMLIISTPGFLFLLPQEPARSSLPLPERPSTCPSPSSHPPLSLLRNRWVCSALPVGMLTDLANSTLCIAPAAVYECDGYVVPLLRT